MKNLYIAFGVFEILVGLAVFFAPLSLLNEQLPGLNLPETGMSMVRFFGAGIISLGVISILASRVQSGKGLWAVTVGFVVYNVLAAYLAFFPSVAPIKFLPAAITHTVFTIAFAYQLTKLRGA